MSETHSCIKYLSSLLKTIVGETSFNRAQTAIEDQSKFKASRLSNKKSKPVLGTLEELFQDTFDGLKQNTMKRYEMFSTFMQGEHEKLIESMNRITEMNSTHLVSLVDTHSKARNLMQPLTEHQNRLNESLASMKKLQMCGLSDLSSP